MLGISYLWISFLKKEEGYYTYSLSRCKILPTFLRVGVRPLSLPTPGDLSILYRRRAWK